jgi:hypothetical protein
MKSIIIALLFMLIASFYFFEVSKLHAQDIAIYSITFEDLNGSSVSKYYFVEGADLSEVKCPEGFDIDGYIFVGWSISLPDKMPSNSMVIEAVYMKTTTIIYQHSIG